MYAFGPELNMLKMATFKIVKIETNKKYISNSNIESAGEIRRESGEPGEQKLNNFDKIISSELSKQAL